MAVVLPLIPSVPDYRVGTTLDGTQYLLDVRWNGRAEAWFMDLLAEDGTAIRLGMKIVLGSMVGGRSRDERFPPGVLLAFDLSGRGVDAGLDDLGTRVIVTYYSGTELA